MKAFSRGARLQVFPAGHIHRCHRYEIISAVN